MSTRRPLTADRHGDGFGTDEPAYRRASRAPEPVADDLVGELGRCASMPEDGDAGDLAAQFALRHAAGVVTRRVEAAPQDGMTAHSRLIPPHRLFRALPGRRRSAFPAARRR